MNNIASVDFCRDREFAYCEADFHQISEIAYHEAGIHLPPNKATLVYSRLVKRLRVAGVSDFGEYVELLKDPSNGQEISAMLSALTTNVTRFYREPHHFQDFRDRVLPQLKVRAENGDGIRIWSAACSTGEEAYSIAFEVMLAIPTRRDHDIRVLATDIDPVVLNTAQIGCYKLESVAKLMVGTAVRFVPTSVDGAEMMSVPQDARDLITFKRLNLIEPWPFQMKMDVIFCRNVTIYFDDITKNGIWAKMKSALHPQGQIYIGHSERICGEVSKDFVSNGLTSYILKNVPGETEEFATNPTYSDGRDPRCR